MKECDYIKKKIFFIILIIGFVITASFIKFNKREELKEVNKTSNQKVVNQEINENKKIFASFYLQAKDKLNTMTIDEKIMQLLLIRYPEEVVNNVGGYVFYEKDFINKNTNEVQDMIENLQKNANIPFITAVDEEGGKIVRISSNNKLIEERFKSSKELYDAGGLNLIKNDTIKKSALLKKLGINLNLAPVVDVADNPNAYMYERTIGYNVSITSEYAKTVIEASKNTDVSYTLKHFPGYGNNLDTHINIATDTRSYDDIMNNDIIPFKKGIEAGAEAVLISHNIITNIDSNNPASLSKNVINILKNELNFSGVVISDDLDMGATKNISNKYLKALKAGIDLIIVTNYNDAFNEIKNAYNNKEIVDEEINEKVLQILAWKYYKLLFTKETK